jgi:hypothetical protein
VLVIRATIEQYEEVRASPRRSMCVIGHEIPRVVSKGHGFVVIEKLGGCREMADEKDPR